VSAPQAPTPNLLETVLTLLKNGSTVVGQGGVEGGRSKQTKRILAKIVLENARRMHGTRF